MYLDKYRKNLPPVCRKYHVNALYAFGSVPTDRFGPDCGLDSMAAFDDMPVEQCAEYRDGVRTRRAVERNVSIIGEAVNRIIKVDGKFDITGARGMVDIRNRANRRCDSVSDETMWSIVTNHLSPRKIEIERMLAQ